MDYGNFIIFEYFLMKNFIYFLGFDVCVLLGHFVELEWKYGGEPGVWG
jgi:hypothetical protein